MSWRHALRGVAAGALVLVLLVALSPVYRDFFLDRRDRYRGASFAAHIGPLEYDRQVMREFTWGGWFWDPYRSMGMPRLQDLWMRPLYPPQLLLTRLLPSLAAWHWNHVLHVVVKVAGLVLLSTALGWPLWVVVLAATGAMLAEGSLAQSGDTTMLLSAAWLPLQLWLTLEAARRTGFTVQQQRREERALEEAAALHREARPLQPGDEAKLERLTASMAPPRDNFYTVLVWLNRILTRAIVLEERSGLTRWMPFGVSLLCVGGR